MIIQSILAVTRLCIALLLIQTVHAFGESIDIVFAAEDDYLYSQGQPRPYTGIVTFEEQPRPLEPCKVTFSIDRNSLPMTANDQTVSLQYDPFLFKVTGDTAWSTANPQGEFTIVPLRSGFARFSIGLAGQLRGRFEVLWCMNPLGDLTYLGKDTQERNCGRSYASFFRDNVVIREQTRSVKGSAIIDLFSYEWRMNTVPSIGIVTYIHLNVLLNTPALRGLDLEVRAEGMDLLELPDRLNGPLNAGDTVIVKLVVRPTLESSIQSLQVVLHNVVDNIPVQKAATLWMIFDSAGQLASISDIGLGDDLKLVAEQIHGSANTSDSVSVYDISARGPEYDKFKRVQISIEHLKGVER